MQQRLSPSIGESFGLAAAEAISSGIPVLLSDIAEHRFLVGAREQYLFPLSDVDALANGIASVADSYDACVSDMLSAREAFSANAFVQDWLALEKELEA